MKLQRGSFSQRLLGSSQECGTMRQKVETKNCSTVHSSVTERTPKEDAQAEVYRGLVSCFLMKGAQYVLVNT